MEKHALSADSVFGFGDAENDLSFLQLLGVTGSPANASAAVKAKVDFVSTLADIAGLDDFLTARVV